MDCSIAFQMFDMRCLITLNFSRRKSDAYIGLAAATLGLPAVYALHVTDGTHFFGLNSNQVIITNCTHQDTHLTMSFEPKTKVELDPPKDDPISQDYLSKCDGMLQQVINTLSSGTDIVCSGSNADYPTYVAIKGTVFDVTGNKAYGPEGSYKGEYQLCHGFNRARTDDVFSVRRQRRLSCSSAVITQA